MAGLVLFACTANICRSPLMESAFRGAGDGGSSVVGWNVSSRGVAVVRSGSMCHFAADLVDTSPSEPAAVAAHRPQQIDRETIDRQHLLIVAARPERARIAQLAPNARSRTFTLLEALALGRRELSDDELARLTVGDGGAHLVEGYAAVLDARRGQVQPAPARRGAFGLRQAPHPYDIPDVHHGGDRAHKRTLRRLRSASIELREQIDAHLKGARP